MIRVIDLGKDLGEFRLQDADLEVEAGEYFVVLGPTGAGKTVLLECIAGVHRPDRGRVWLDGADVTRLPPEQRLIGYVPQEYALFPHMSVERNMAFGMRMRRVPAAERRERVRRLAATLNIAHLLQRRPMTLSGGEQQRVALARALAIRPKVLLLDEPLSALDEQTRDELSDELADIPAQTGACVVHVCHNLEEAARLADRVAVLNRGRIVQVGTAPEVFQRPATRFVAEFVGTRNIFDGTAQPSRAEGMCEVGIGGRLLLAPDVGLRGAVCAAVRPEEIEVAARDSELVGANVFRGRLRKAEDRGAMVHLELDVGVPLVALMSRQVYRRARVKVGDDVRVGFPPNAVHVFAADAGEPPEEGTSAD